VRGGGLFFAVEMVRDRATKAPAPAQTKRIVNGMRERGVLLSRIGIHDNILKIRPPMPFRTEHADLLLKTLDDVMTSL
jgi:4-aminobutyrate aminotransferase-like enzyme